MMTRTQADGLYAALLTADEAADAEALAEIAWRLYGELGQMLDRTRGHEMLLARLADAARAAITSSPADQPDPLYSLRHILTGGLWLSQPDGGIRHPAPADLPAAGDFAVAAR